MASNLATIETDSHQACVKLVLGICAQLLKTAGLGNNSYEKNLRKSLWGGIHPPPLVCSGVNEKEFC